MPTYRDLWKRILDVLLASAAGIVAAPVMAVLAIAIRSEDRGPALFRQARVGRDGLPFTFLKFRTMPEATKQVESAEAVTLTVTKIGRWLRRTSLDELPQLWNIIRGDMSIVGPRPALPSQHLLLDARAANGSLALRPGLTGLAQVRAYDGMPWEEKAACDGEYAYTVSLSTDLAIIAATFRYLAKPPPRY